MSTIAFTTPHLLLRSWRDEDLAPFAALNADPRVMEHFPGTLDRGASDALAAKIREELERSGFGLWAVELPRVAPFIGFVGLSESDFDAPFTPCVEIGWRLAFAHWGKGYATEAARPPSPTPSARSGSRSSSRSPRRRTWRSRAVMERLGMTRSPADDFEHPKLPVGHPLRRHVLYRLRRG